MPKAQCSHPAKPRRGVFGIGIGLCLGWVLFFSPSTASGTEPVPIKFELDVQPILTARGCNSGPCHGKSRGQNGFALSLLVFDADLEFRSIVTDGRGRRVSPASPADSLFLQKATGQLPHGGGKRLEPDSHEAAVLSRCISNGFLRTS
ncbi:MAG: hypothetical protein ACK52S_22710 [Pirellula sp.]